MTPTRTMTPTTSYSPSNYNNISYFSASPMNTAPVLQEIVKVNINQPIDKGSDSISLLNVDPSALSAFKEGNIIKSDDGNNYEIVSVIITYYTPSPSSNANYSENFKEGIDDANVTIGLDRNTMSEINYFVIYGSARPNAYNTTPSSYSAAPNAYNTTPSSYIAAPNSNKTTPNSYNTALNNTDLTDITNKIQKKLVDDIVNGINTKFTPGSQCNSYNSAMPNASYNSNYGSQYQPQYQHQTGPSSNPILRPKTNNVFQSGNMSVNVGGQITNDTPGQLPSTSESKTQVNFPNTYSPSDIYSYYHALRTKGADYVPLNAITETNKRLGRLVTYHHHCR